jgi:hypothetical protein
MKLANGHYHYIVLGQSEVVLIYYENSYMISG